jgi:flagellar biosynthesis protein FlhF
MLTADTYRIAATEQLQTYANILEVPLEVVMAGDDINERIRKFADKDLILVDTAGFSHKNAEQKEAMKNLLDSVDPTFTKDVYLVLSATTRFGDMKAIIDSYKEFTDFHLIFTKLDETSVYGPIFSSKLYADADLSYVTEGQNVPDDMEVINIQKIVKTLLGGR